jgi:hypothetical protein
MKFTLLRFVCFAAIAIALSFTNAVAQSAAGAIKAARVTGQVFKVTAAGQSVALKDGDLLIESDTVTTGKGAGVVLVFMNGSSVKLGGDSKLAIDEFKMDPLAEDIKVSDLKNEPSVSKTALNLSYGEMVGDVKKLNTASSYTIKTPVGAAGIRGTQFMIRFMPSGDGRAFNFQLSTNEGLVDFRGTAAGAGLVQVPANVEVTVVANVDPATNQITSVSISVPTTISAEAKAAIVSAVETAIQQAQQTTTITVTEQTSVSVTTPPTTQTNQNNTQQTQDTTTNPTNPSQQQQQQQQLTPGAGRTE